MILKLLLIIGVIGVVYFIFFKKKAPKKANISSKSKSKNKKVESNDMVECASCGIYCELNEAILSNAKYYCSDECVDSSK